MRSLVLALCLAAALALPAAASAMPIDNGPLLPPPHKPASPTRAREVRTIVRTSGDTLAVALAGIAVLVAVTSAGYTAIRLRPAS